MLARTTILKLLLIYGSRRVRALLQPTTPGPGERYAAGSNCAIAWTPDTSGSWTNVTIDLMSGPNNNMSLVTNVASELDGTDASLTPYSWTCPEVDPYSAIYFYQFTNGDDISTRTWTTRFTIASPSNETVTAENAQQPNGDAVPWGVGQLKDKESTSATSGMSGSPSVQSTFSLKSAMEFSYVPSATSTGKKPHGHKAGDADADDEGHDGEDEDGEDGKDGDDMKSTASPSKTHTVNAGGAKSAAARATSMARTNGSPPSSSDDPGSDESYESDPNGAQAGNPSSYESADNDRSQSSLPGSYPRYKNSGEADAADSANALEGCPCGYTSNRKNGAAARLPASGFIPSIATSFISALLLAFF